MSSNTLFLNNHYPFTKANWPHKILVNPLKFFAAAIKETVLLDKLPLFFTFVLHWLFFRHSYSENGANLACASRNKALISQFASFALNSKLNYVFRLKLVEFSWWFLEKERINGFNIIVLIQKRCNEDIGLFLVRVLQNTANLNKGVLESIWNAHFALGNKTPTGWGWNLRDKKSAEFVKKHWWEAVVLYFL